MTNYAAAMKRPIDPTWEDKPAYVEMKARTLSNRKSGLVRHRERIFAAGELGPASNCSLINPGALHKHDKIYMMLRGEGCESTWHGQWDHSLATPIWCVLGEDLALLDHFELHYDALPDGHRAEDWRLFEWNERLYTNHSVYLERDQKLQCRTGISEINLETRTIKLNTILEAPIGKSIEEKNWGIFSDCKSLMCLYSIDPYIVIEIDLDHSETKVIIDAGRLNYKWFQKGAKFVGNSTNPIIWDDEHYITFVHDFLEPEWPGQRNRVYMQYAILINRSTLLPSSVVPNPLVIGGSESGRHPGVHYTMSLVNRKDALYTFFGEADTHAGAMLFDKEVLSELFHEFSL